MYLLEGKISVKAALLSPYRNVSQIILDDKKNDRDTRFIIKKAKEMNVEILYKPRVEIDTLVSGKTYGGIVAYVEERTFQSLDEVYHDKCFLAIVEGIEDPYNFGFVLRSLYAAGVNALIMSERNWTSAASTLAKSSAGASEYMPMIICSDFPALINEMKQKGIKILCAQRDKHSIEIYDADYTESICICIGGEKRGLSKNILEQSDQNVYIPYQNDFKNALSAASAATVIAYEAMRQRRSIK